MQKLLIACLTVLLLVVSTNSNSSSPLDAKRHREFVIVRVKYTLKKTGITSQVYIDIGMSKGHSLKGALEHIADGVIKIGYGSDVAVLTNEVDMLNYFSSRGWIIESISDLKILSNSYTQYLFSKEASE